MKHPDYNSPAALKALLDTNNMSMQKKFGQNFLINETARKKLIERLDINENSTIWEIGPGLGSMTIEILKKHAKLTAFEIDRGFTSLLLQFFEEYTTTNTFELVQGDVLKNWYKIYEQKGKPDCLFGNLPYNIAAAIIGDTIEKGIRFNKILVTVQKEVAERMCAVPGDKNYSSFSVLCEWAYNVEAVMDLNGGNFWPRPNVESRAVLMTPKKEYPDCDNISLFMKMQRALFSSRRKTVKNNLNNFYSDKEKVAQVISAAGINPSARAETLSIQTLLLLSDKLNAVIL